MAGFFNTSWNIGNAFNSPFSMDQGELTNQESFLPMEKDARGLVERPGGYGPTGTPTWGAPTGYDPSQQQSNIFNPYSAGGNNYYNPYSFGQMTSGIQYGGGQEMPWWMNYNTNNAVPNIPTTPVNTMDQGKYVGNPNHSGTGPNGKDLTYDETIKYFGLYDNAESALAAGDSQAAYRKDHMQWRSGTGYYEGQGEGQGDYPGRPDLGIDGDAQRMTDLMGFPQNLLSMLTGQSLDNTNSISSSSGMNSNFLNQERGVEGSVPMLPPQQQTMQSYLDDSQKYNMRNYNSDNVEMALASGLIDPERVEVISPQDWRIQFPETQKDYNKGFERAENLFNTPSSANYFQQVGPQSGLPVPQFLPDRSLQIRSYTNYPLEDYSADSRFQPMNRQFSALDNYKTMLGIQDKFTGEQISPYGRTENGMTVPVPLEDINIFSNIRDTSAIDALAAQAQAKVQAEAEAKAQAQAAEAKAQAQAAEAKAQAQAQAAEKARQATAAQSRMNDRYETGPVTPNRYTTKNVNNSFAARRDIRNIFA